MWLEWGCEWELRKAYSKRVWYDWILWWILAQSTGKYLLGYLWLVCANLRGRRAVPASWARCRRWRDYLCCRHTGIFRYSWRIISCQRKSSHSLPRIPLLWIRVAEGYCSFVSFSITSNDCCWFFQVPLRQQVVLDWVVCIALAKSWKQGW